VTIWCAVSAHGILGPYFIEDEEGNALTVTQGHYRDMVIGPFLQDLRRFCRARGLHINRQWYQQDVFSFQYCIFWGILYYISTTGKENVEWDRLLVRFNAYYCVRNRV
jgi:hypothetical protein